LEEVISVNEYFAAHPEMMLGEMRLAGRMYQRGEPTLEGNGRDLTEQLKEAVARLPVNVFHARQFQTLTTANEQSYPAPEEVKPNAYCIVQGDICVREGDSVRVLSDLNSQTRKRIRGLIQVRDAVRRCLRSQLQGHDETEVLAARTELNSVYDSFIARNGANLAPRESAGIP
jgi:N12 class adenine-specific DNA methylase